MVHALPFRSRSLVRTAAATFSTRAVVDMGPTKQSPT